MKRLLLSLFVLSLSACGGAPDQADVAQAFGTAPPPSAVGGPCGREGYVCKTGLICQLPPPINGQQSHLGTCVALPPPAPAPIPCDPQDAPKCPDGMHCESTEGPGSPGQCRPDDSAPLRF